MNQPYATQEAFSHLESRVSTAEQEIEGEKLVSRYILNQSRQNGDELAVVKTRLDRVEQKVDRIEAELMSLRGDFSSLKNNISSLKQSLPTIVADAMRDVLRENKIG